MSPSRAARRLLAPVVAVALAAGCSAPAMERLARAPVAVVEERLGAAPSWDDASSDGDGRVRALLAAPLEERGAVEVALVRSRRLRALIGHAVAEALSAHAEAAPSNPVLDLLVRWPHGSGGPLVDAGLSLGLLDLLRLPGRDDAAELAARGAALEAEEAIVESVAEVRAAWVEAVAARQREALDADAAETASIAADLADRQHAAGTLAELDRLRFRAFADEASVALERARMQSHAAAERLVRALGVHGDEAALTLAAALPPVSAADAAPGDAESRAVARRLDVERARVRVVEARLAAGIAGDARVLPGLGAGGSFERESDGARSSGPSVAVELPLSAKEAAHAEAAKARVREAEDRLYDVAVRARSQAREAADALAGASSVAARHRDAIVPRRAAAVEEAQLRYNGMLLGVYDLLAEKREELRARRDLVDAVRDAWLARIALDLAVGGEPVRTPAEGAAGPAAPPARDEPMHHHHGGK